MYSPANFLFFVCSFFFFLFFFQGLGLHYNLSRDWEIWRLEQVGLVGAWGDGVGREGVRLMSQSISVLRVMKGKGVELAY